MSRRTERWKFFGLLEPEVRCPLLGLNVVVVVVVYSLKQASFFTPHSHKKEPECNQSVQILARMIPARVELDHHRVFQSFADHHVHVKQRELPYSTVKLLKGVIINDIRS